MSGNRGIRRRFGAVAAAITLLLLAAPALSAAGREGDRVTAERRVDGMRLIALAPARDAPSDISILPPDRGLERIAAALRLIAHKSPSNAAIIRRLKAAGAVTLIYYPNNFRDRNRLNTQTVALFAPGFLKRHGLGGENRSFPVLINQFGVKWPAAELAAVIVHELAGHGVQHLENRIASARLLDLECEASLYQEQAYQDLGVPKKARTVVLFRRQMEFRYCADFRGYMKTRMPGKLALWDPLNPDVAAILGVFRDYRGTQAAALPAAAAPTNVRSR
jgi:hypothetical protein